MFCFVLVWESFYCINDIKVGNYCKNLASENQTYSEVNTVQYQYTDWSHKIYTNLGAYSDI